jgi:hypothetical protein
VLEIGPSSSASRPIDLGAQVAWRQVAVHLGGDPRGAVAEDALDGGWVRAGHHEQAPGGVAEVVEPDHPLEANA